ncbi:MAG: CHAP domain-containing protein [Clostridiaceae bacterium]|nr:CHAP domain-containing protein [Clostridiaceae bacterium]
MRKLGVTIIISVFILFTSCTKTTVIDNKSPLNKATIGVDKKDDIKVEAIGDEIDSYKGVKVYNNGKDYVKNYGKNSSKDGYYYGYKWQCVEFIKRFYYDVKAHKMPDGFGNAKDFFDVSLKDGALNKKRGLLQFKNGGKTKPESDDLIVFNDTKYGHVAIVTEVGADYIEIVQQNIYNTPRAKLMLSEKDGNYLLGDTRKPAGWLRK